MGLFDKMFGKKKEETAKPASPPPQAQARAPPPSGGGAGGAGVTQSMEQLDNAIELLEKREQVLDKKVEAEVTRAKELLAKNNKQLALQCMKRKKMYEEQILKLQAQRDNMETMRFTLQEQAMNKEVLQATTAAGQQLQHMNSQMNADTIEDQMDDTREAMEQAHEVSNALTQPLNQDIIDEDELLGELDALAGEPAVVQTTPAHNIAQPAKQQTLPPELAGLQVPAGNMPAKPVQSEEEAALAALEAELNA